MVFSARTRSLRMFPWSVGVALVLMSLGCGEKPAEEPSEATAAAEATAVAAAAQADQDSTAPVRRWLPDEMSRSTRAENFPHNAHVTISCAVCHAAPRGHTVHKVLPCAECHTSSALVTRLSLTPADCMACHHGAERNIPCGNCHTPPGPRTTQQTLKMSVWPAPRAKAFPFDHGRHGTVDCRTCHQQRPSMAPTRTCASCHAEHHTPTARCQTCHDQPPAAVHGPRAHLGCAGSGCHTAPDINAISGTRPVCLVCHQAQEGHEVGKQCADCHQVRPGEQAPNQAPLHGPSADQRAGQW